MSLQHNISNLLVELSAEEQQLLSGGCYKSTPCCKPRKQKCGGNYPKYDQCTPSDSYESYSDTGDKYRD
ncbi:hypothetical protein [Trichormus variabilis]|uniref:Uncharacterized protein n=1 Tax=Trichormus variabilis SAG 1403-4b TaxID=447716 RepID=A0A433UIL3_ANAVA|nr:hypothetical protein [Trichormus variabilis]MBD2629519.1 hypothetical protein [Trichormus variabilis FACHB-164]RUS93665.1 hypothetical protein DSM107003_41660 [Trichormus variabilis SAG 1403-4b]